MRRALATGAVVIGMLLNAPVARAAPTNPLCDSGAYRRAHPLICDTGGDTPGSLPGSGGGGNGGLLGVISRVVGGLL